MTPVICTTGIEEKGFGRNNINLNVFTLFLLFLFIS